jgi:YidC/Oxa1 family membrane protein insertase
MVASISNFFSWVLQLLHGLVPSYPLDIILMTVLLKLILEPLTYHQLRTSFLMSSVQGELQEISKKYKNDPQKAAQEQQRIYREHGINPIIGCLLPLLQIPIFLGLYGSLVQNPSFKGLGFLWVSDISKPDPTWITVIVMVLVCYFQFRFTSQTTNDPNMQRQQNMMMWVFVIMIGFIARSFPFGVAIYWLVYSLISIVESVVIRRMVERQLAAKKEAAAQK